MKRLFIAILAAMIWTDGNAAEEGVVWSTAVVTRPSDGHRIVYRYRSEFGPSFNRSAFPDRVVIAWSYKSENGLPSKAERESMDRMEDILTPYVEQTSLSTLALVSTGEGLREWVYYTRSKSEFMAKVNEALRGHPRFPLEIDLWTDPEWKRYEEFMRKVQK